MVAVVDGLMEQERFNQLGRRYGGYSRTITIKVAIQCKHNSKAQDAFQNQQQRMQQAGQLGVQGANMYGHLGSRDRGPRTNRTRVVG